MAVFSYRTSTRSGEILEGVIEAADENSAIKRLKDTGVIPLKVTAQKEIFKIKTGLRSSKADIQAFTEELSVLINAGLPLDKSLDIILHVTENSGMKSIVQSLQRSVREGSSFSDALIKHPRIFPRLYINMVRAGEASGVLHVVLEKLNEFLESSKELKDNIISSMIYPSILIITGGISLIVLMTFVLPKFSAIFAELGGALPLPTRILISASKAIKAIWWLLLPAIIAGWIAVKYYISTPGGRYKWDAIKIKSVGDLIAKLETARFCRTLGMLLKSGVPLIQALNNAKDVISNQVFASALNAVSKGAKEGRGIVLPLTEANIFPPLALSMIKVGEDTGQLDDMLLKVASTYEKALRETVKRFMSLLEPLMILLMGLIIGFIVISMLIGIFSITDLPI
ncbi:MAG: type II secretion system F family protein [Pseudomonadota bacterium]